MRNSRHGIADGVNGNYPMDIEDIRKDADRVRNRRAGLAKLGLAQGIESMKVTKEQEAVLGGLVCERLRDNSNSRDLIQNFQSERGALIVEYLKLYGFAGGF